MTRCSPQRAPIWSPKAYGCPQNALACTSIDIPSAPERKWAELIPWMLEDRVLQPVDEMHFVVADRDDQQLHILAVSQQDMREWIRIADNAGIAASAMAPDFMALDLGVRNFKCWLARGYVIGQRWYS